jgi:hypothetical protein
MRTSYSGRSSDQCSSIQVEPQVFTLLHLALLAVGFLALFSVALATSLQARHSTQTGNSSSLLIVSPNSAVASEAFTPAAAYNEQRFNEQTYREQCAGTANSYGGNPFGVTRADVKTATPTASAALLVTQQRWVL